jgi:hypothetical protein
VREAPTFDRSNTPTRGSECSCRSAIENADRIQRLETTGIDVPADSGPLGARDRPICLDMESTIEPVCQLDASAGSNGSRRFFPELDQSEGIRISPIQYDRQMSDKDHEGRGRINSGGTGLASATVVADHHGASLAAPPNNLSGDSIALGPIGQPPPSSGTGIPPVSRLDIVRRRFKNSGFSERVVQLLVESNREATSACYQSSWNGWLGWCAQRDQDPVSASLTVVLDFLSELHEEGKAYRSINVSRSMLSATLSKIEGYDVGKHPLVIKLMLGIFNSNPPKPRYNSFWDIGSVLSYLEGLGPDTSLSFKNLSSKLVMLLALTSLFRVSEIAAIDFKSIVFSGPVVKFALSRLRKSQRKGSLQVFSLNRIGSSLLNCPVSCLERYIFVTSEFRKESANSSLILGLRSPHPPIGASTIGRWIKLLLSEAGVDTTTYSAHSTRGASASKAVSAGLSIDSILKTGSWASESVFSKHYNRPINKDTFGMVILAGEANEDVL